MDDGCGFALGILYPLAWIGLHLMETAKYGMENQTNLGAILLMLSGFSLLCVCCIRTKNEWIVPLGNLFGFGIGCVLTAVMQNMPNHRTLISYGELTCCAAGWLAAQLLVVAAALVARDSNRHRQRVMLMIWSCIPFVFFGMYLDATFGIVSGMLCAIVVICGFGYACMKSGNLPFLPGQFIGFFLSYGLMRFFMTEKWGWYFKPFSASGYLIFFTLILVIPQLLVPMIRKAVCRMKNKEGRS